MEHPSTSWKDALGAVTTEREQRIDALLTRLSETTGGEAAEDLRGLIIEEIRTSQRVRTFALWATVGLILAFALAGTFYWQSRQADEQSRQADDRLLERLRAANNEVQIIEHDNGTVGIRLVPGSNLDEADRSRAEGMFADMELGRFAGLGAGIELRARLDPTYSGGLRYALMPPRDSVEIGRLTLTSRPGRLTTQTEAIAPQAPPRAFEDLPRFGIQLLAFDPSTRTYSVKFCERDDAGAWACAATSYEVRKSHAGRQQEHHLATHADWSSVYFVSIGLGEQGEGGQVWTVDARATKLGLDTAG